MNVILIAILIWAVCFGGSCAIIASSKNRSCLGWFLLGATFGIFALVVICALPAIASSPAATTLPEIFQRAQEDDWQHAERQWEDAQQRIAERSLRRGLA